MISFLRFLAYVGGVSLVLNIVMGIYIYAIGVSGNLRSDWQSIVGILVFGNMVIAGILVAIGMLISHFIGEVEEVT